MLFPPGEGTEDPDPPDAEVPDLLPVFRQRSEDALSRKHAAPYSCYPSVGITLFPRGLPSGDPLFDIVEISTGQRRSVAADLRKNTPVDGERGVVVPAVDIDRDDPLDLLPDFPEEPAGGGGPPGPQQTTEDGGEGAPAP